MRHAAIPCSGDAACRQALAAIWCGGPTAGAWMELGAAQPAVATRWRSCSKMQTAPAWQWRGAFNSMRQQAHRFTMQQHAAGGHASRSKAALVQPSSTGAAVAEAAAARPAAATAGQPARQQPRHVPCPQHRPARTVAGPAAELQLANCAAPPACCASLPLPLPMPLLQLPARPEAQGSGPDQEAAQGQEGGCLRREARRGEKEQPQNNHGRASWALSGCCGLLGGLPRCWTAAAVAGMGAACAAGSQQEVADVRLEACWQQLAEQQHNRRGGQRGAAGDGATCGSRAAAGTLNRPHACRGSCSGRCAAAVASRLAQPVRQSTAAPVAPAHSDRRTSQRRSHRGRRSCHVAAAERGAAASCRFPARLFAHSPSALPTHPPCFPGS